MISMNCSAYNKLPLAKVSCNSVFSWFWCTTTRFTWCRTDSISVTSCLWTNASSWQVSLYVGCSKKLWVWTVEGYQGGVEYEPIHFLARATSKCSSFIFSFKGAFFCRFKTLFKKFGHVTYKDIKYEKIYL